MAVPSSSSSSSSSSHGAAASLPTTMRAIQYSEYGDASKVLEARDDVAVCAADELASSELLVRVHASAIDPVDYKCVAGHMRVAELDRRFPITPGFNVAGTVVAVGAACARVAVGDAVIGYAQFRVRGALAEYVRIDERCCVARPQRMSFVEAATLPLVGVTSVQALLRRAGLRAGQSLLVLGGTTATGLAALQIARAHGATSIVCTCSARNTELVRSLGATDVVDYRSADWRDALRGRRFDVVYDCVGGAESYAACADAERGIVKANGAYVTIVGDVQGDINVTRAVTTVSNFFSRTVFAPLTSDAPSYALHLAKPTLEDIDEVRRLADDGKLRAIVDTEYSFASIDEVRAAFAMLMSGRSLGKQVIVMIED